MKEINEMSLRECFELQKKLGKSIEERVRMGEDIRKRGEIRKKHPLNPTLVSEEKKEKMIKKCVICGKRHSCREYTCSDECHEVLKQNIIKAFGEYKIIVDAVTGKEHRVPIVDIIEKGIKQEDLKNYPILEGKLEVSWINLDTYEVEVKHMTYDEYKKEIG